MGITENESETPVTEEVPEETEKPTNYSISLKMYGNIDMIDGIKQANSISDGDFIKEGDRILLP